MTDQDAAAALRRALEQPDPSARLGAALAAGTRPHDAFARVLVDRCAVEPDFFVRDMLTWAVSRLPADRTVPLLLDAAATGSPQARSQAFHSLSKVRDPRGWAAVGEEAISDPDDEVARAAWRCAVTLAPDDARADLAARLAQRLGRGGPELRRSLSRALADLGPAAVPAIERATAAADEDVRVHAIATERLLDDPDEGFEAAIAEARRVAALAAAPTIATEEDRDADR